MKQLNWGRVAISATLSLLTLAFFALSPQHAAGAMGVAVAYDVLTNSAVNAIWAKAQGKLKVGYNFMVPEFKWVQEFSDKQIDTSLREMTYPVHLNEDRGVASIPEGGWEAEPSSVNAVDATITLIHLNARFTISKRAKWAKANSPGAALKDQFMFQGETKMQALARVAGDMFYGYSTNYICQTSTNATQASGTYTLLNAYGDSAITNAAYIANLIKVGDRVALVRSGTLVANSAGGLVTAVTPATPSVAITWNGSVDSDANDYLVFANSMDATTITHTSYNLGLIGLRDICTSTSVHGISASTDPHWSAAYSDTNAGRFNGTKWRRGLDAMQDDGHDAAQPKTIMAKGVRRDVASQYAAGVRFDDSMDMEIDGEPKARGKKFKGTKRVPPGTVTMFDQKKALYKKVIHEAGEKAPSWGDAKELQNQSGWVFAVEWSGLMGVDNRKLFSYFENQAEQ